MKPIYNKLSEEKHGDGTCHPAVDFGGSLERDEWCSRRRIILAACLLCSVMITICLITLCFLMIHRTKTQQNEVTFHETSLTGHGGVPQKMFASVEDNYVQYYVSTYLSEQTWILDDFNMNLQIIKSQTDSETICYVSKLNTTEAVHPTRASVQQLAVKKNYHDVYSPDEFPVTDRSFLSQTGKQLCEGVDIYWLRQMEDVIDLTDLSEQMNETISAEGSFVRRKRNIPACHSSCCWLVCCCDVHHFTWETTEHFTCRHVCDKCTEVYKQKIQKIC